LYAIIGRVVILAAIVKMIASLSHKKSGIFFINFGNVGMSHMTHMRAKNDS